MAKANAKKQDAATILIIEDELDVRDTLARLLTAEGYNVRLASNGWEGLLALDNPPHLVLLDIMLPGMDGYMFLKSMRGQRTYQAIPVVVLTALDVDDVTPKLRPYGVGHVIAKSDSVFPKLKAAIRTLVGKPRPHARVSLSQPGSAIRPHLELYMKMLAWS